MPSASTPSASSFSSTEDRAFAFTPPGPAAGSRQKRAPRLLAFFLAGFGAWALFIGARAQIVRVAPPTAPLYAALGLDVNRNRMGLDHVASRLDYEDGRQVLIVEGEIRNRASSSRAAPRMRLSVLDAGGREIYHWIAAPPKSRLAAGEAAEFRARLAAPPKEGQQVRVRLAGGPESPAASW